VGVEVRDVLFRDHVLQEAQVLAPDPRQDLALRDGGEVAPHGVARHEPFDAEQLRRRRVAVQPVDVTEPRSSVDHRHHDGRNQVAHPRGVVACEFHRTRLDETLEEPARLREPAR